MSSKTLRMLRRRAAEIALPTIEKQTGWKATVHRPDYAHITIMGPDGQSNVQWWPGTSKWAYDFGTDTGRCEGSYEDLIKFIRDHRRMVGGA